MNTTIIIAVVQLIGSLATSLTSSTQVAQVITTLEAWLPTIMRDISELVPVVQGIIATLQGSDTLTPEQVAAIDILNAQVDAAFDVAAEAAKKEEQQ